MNPKAIKVTAVRIQAIKVRSAAKNMRGSGSTVVSRLVRIVDNHSPRDHHNGKSR
jgi:hypothetical protein